MALGRFVEGRGMGLYISFEKTLKLVSKVTQHLCFNDGHNLVKPYLFRLLVRN